MAMLDHMTDTPTHWVFGYGSLIWNPGFPYLSAQQGLLRGAHRSLSIVSHHHRGTVELNASKSLRFIATPCGPSALRMAAP